MDKEVAKIKISKEEDFVYSNKHDHSLKKLIMANPQGISDDKIAKALIISTEEVEKLYQSAIIKLRSIMESRGFIDEIEDDE